jgi:hypothetical protein
MKNLNILIITFSIILFSLSCTDSNNEPKSGKITLAFVNKINDEPLVLSTKKYIGLSGESFEVEKFKYYISNIKLRNKNDGSYYIEPESYHLITPDEKSNVVNLQLEVPIAEYDLIEFGIGVDSLKNTSLSYDGDLDPNNSMAWDWKSGYKFLAFEGKFYTAATGENGGGLVFHIGENKNFTMISLALQEGTTGLKVSSKEKTISIKVAIEEMWKSPNLIKFDELSEAMFGEDASKIVENYKEGMFSIESIN